MMWIPLIVTAARNGLGRLTALALAFGFIVCYPARAELTGPVVGFVRVQVVPGPQWVEPPVRPSAARPQDGESAGQALKNYLGESFQASTSVDDADWVGCTSTQEGIGEVSLIWRDFNDQWHDLLGSVVEPGCTGAFGFWLDLFFSSDNSTAAPTRELVLSGEVVWPEAK